MEATKPLINQINKKLKQATLLWLEGFREACCLHRVVILCFRSRKLLIRTGQCFLLNGFIFLGSIIVLNSVVIPILQWILPDDCSQISSQELCSFGSILKFYSFLRLGLVQLFYVFWFYPLYVFSLILSNIWYNDIAKFGFSAMGRSGSPAVEASSQNEALTVQNTATTERPAGLGGFLLQDLYHMQGRCSISYYFLGCMPTIVSNTSGIFLRCLWTKGWTSLSLTGHFLLVLFVLTATGSGAEQDISFERRKWRGVGLGRLPIFYVADTLSLHVLSLFTLESREQIQDNKTL